MLVGRTSCILLSNRRLEPPNILNVCEQQHADKHENCTVPYSASVARSNVAPATYMSRGHAVTAYIRCTSIKSTTVITDFWVWFYVSSASILRLWFLLQINENSGTGGKRSGGRKRKAHIIDLLDQVTFWTGFHDLVQAASAQHAVSVQLFCH